MAQVVQVRLHSVLRCLVLFFWQQKKAIILFPVLLLKILPVGHHLEVSCPAALWQTVPEADRAALQGVLANDPRPSYQHDPQRVYGMEFAGLEVHFTVDGAQLTVRDITLL